MAPVMRPRRQVPNRLPIRLAIAAALVAAGLAASACGQSRSTTILDTEKVERAIERSSLTQRNTHTTVSCPSGVRQKKGLTFSCTAIVKGGSARFTVRQLDDAGRVHYEAR